MRKFFWVLFLLFGFFFSCSFQEKKEEILIGFSQLTSNDDWRREMNQEILTEAELYSEYNVSVVLKDAAYDSELQVRQIEELIALEVDVLIVSPNEAAPLTPVIEKAYEKGIPIVLLDRMIQSEKYSAFVSGNNKEVGQLAANYANQFSNKNIIEITGLKSSTPAIDRSLGFHEKLKELGLSVSESLYSNWQYDDAYRLADSLFATKTIDFVFAHNDQMAKGARDAALNHGQNPKILGVDGLNYDGGGIDMVLNKTIDGSLYYPTAGDEAVQIAVKLANREQVAKQNQFSSFLITQQNAQSLKFYGIQINEERAKLSQQIEQVDQVSNLLHQANNNFLLALLSSLFLLSTLALSVYLINIRNRKNRLLKEQTDIIKHQNDRISKQRDDLVLAIRKVEEIAEFKSNFFQNLSHELKNHIALIQLDAEKMSEQTENKRAAHHLQYNLDKLQKTVHNLLSFKNVDDAKVEVNFIQGDLGEFIKEIIENFKPNIENKGLNLETSIESIVCEFDKSIVEVVLNNLLSNATKYTNEGTIRVSLSEKDNLVEIEVSDTGIGIAKSDIETIFQRFGRGHQFENTENSHGIGLAYAQDLLFLHDGLIKVESEVYKGSTFTIQFPKNYHSQQKVDQKLIHLDDDDKKKRILVVEDNKQFRNHLANILEEYFEVKLAVNGLDGLGVLNQWKPDLILSDILMDKMDGIEFCSKVKSNRETAHIPVVLLTAMSSQDTVMRAYDLGADDFINKPFQKPVIISRIKNLIEKQEQSNTLNSLLNGQELSNENQPFLNQVTQLIVTNINNDNFQIDDLVKELNMSRTAFYKQIKATTKLSPVAYVRKVKLHRAAEFLQKGKGMTVAEVAYESGFSDTKYFSRQFKKEFGVNPSGYIG